MLGGAAPPRQERFLAFSSASLAFSFSLLPVPLTCSSPPPLFHLIAQKCWWSQHTEHKVLAVTSKRLPSLALLSSLTSCQAPFQPPKLPASQTGRTLSGSGFWPRPLPQPPALTSTVLNYTAPPSLSLPVTISRSSFYSIDLTLLLEATMLEKYFLAEKEVTSVVFFSCFLKVFPIVKAFSIVKKLISKSYKILTCWDPRQHASKLH